MIRFLFWMLFGFWYNLLGNYALYLTPSNIRARNNPKYEPDPDIERCEALIELLQAALDEKTNDNPNG